MTADPIIITLEGPPKGKGRPRFGKGRTYTPAPTVAYETQLGWAARAAMKSRKPFEVPVKVLIKAFLPIPKSWPKTKREASNGEFAPIKPDWDNAGKVTDALNGICWRDDVQVVNGQVLKIFSERPRLEIIVEPA